ncbi:major facilitator superfamily multidrug-resistance, DHA1 sub-family [Mycena filopes]|nr:major facilitator superfamily multidrug-resistance, DHA1 sub-family [Mycena filopes]
MSAEEDRVLRKRTPIPKFQLAILLLIQLAEPITAFVIYPFVVQLVRDTGVTGGQETKTGFYAGLLESTFFLSESFTVLQFGRLSDVHGRRPVLLWGPLVLGLAMLAFGLSKTFWLLLFFRSIQGVCNGNIGLTKTVMNEISDPTNVADIFSTLPMMWAVSATLGPLIGGLLANPADKWPTTLGKIHILKDHPYLLPCAVAATISLIAFGIAFVGLKETLPSIIKRRHSSSSSPATETDPLLPASTSETQDAPLPIRDLLTRPLLISLVNHGLLTFLHMGNESLLPLFFATPIGLGGLGLKPYNIGLILGTFGLCNAGVQIVFGGRVIRRYGARRVFTAGFCALVVEFAMFPVGSMLARRAGRVDATVYMAIAFQLSCSCAVFFAYASTMLFIMDAAPGGSVGSVNGLAQVVGTVLRGLAPSFASSLFSLSAEHRLVGGNLVYIVLIVLALTAARCSLLLPRYLRSESGPQH